MRDIRWKRILIIAWACLLAFGLMYQAEVAEAAHSNCSVACSTACGPGNCALYGQEGCSCTYLCDNGESGRTICM